MTLRPVAVLIVLSLLSGCAVEKTNSMEVSKRLSLTWERSDWRICDQRECPAPTSKTVLLVAAPPTVEPVVREPTKPIQVARKLAPISMTFQFASATLSGLAEMEIKKAVALIEPGDSILVEGRTDDLGSQAFNDRLARKRAEVVAAYLKRLGVKARLRFGPRESAATPSPTTRTSRGRSTGASIYIFLLPKRSKHVIPRSKESIRDYLIASAFMALGSFLPGSLLDKGFEAHIGGIALGIGLGWLIKSIIDHTKGVKSES